MRRYTETAKYGPIDRDCGENVWKQLLQDIRLEKQVTQNWVAEEAGVSITSIALVEEGRFNRLKKLTVLSILNQYFGTPHDTRLVQAMILLKLMDPKLSTLSVPVVRRKIPDKHRPKNRAAVNKDPWTRLLNRIRLEKYLTQEQIAEKLGLHTRLVVRFEAGRFAELSTRTTASILQEYFGSSMDSELLEAISGVGLAGGTATLEAAAARIRANSV